MAQVGGGVISFEITIMLSNPRLHSFYIFWGLSGFLDIRLRQTEHKHSMTAIAQLDSLACRHGGGKAGWWLLLAVFLACSCISASENH